MTRKLALALSVAALLSPALASARSAPAGDPGCAHCFPSAVAGGEATSVRRAAHVGQRAAAPAVAVTSGAATSGRRAVVARKASASGRLAASAQCACGGGSCAHRA